MNEIDVILTEKQSQCWKYLTDNVTVEVGYGGAAGGGKSWLIGVYLTMMCLGYEKTRWLLGRSELKNLKDTTLVTLFKVFNYYNIEQRLYNYNQQSNIITFVNGSEIILKDLKYKPSDPLITELGSLELTGAVIDEITEISFQVYEVILSRINRCNNDTHGLIGKVFGAGNPVRNWFYKRFIQNPYPQTVFIQALVTDNEFRETNYVSGLERLQSKQLRERLLYGNWNYDDDGMRLFNVNSLYECCKQQELERGFKYITADIARMGKDKTIIVLWSGLSIEKVIVKQGINTQESSALIKELATKNNIPIYRVIVDEDGVGGGVVDTIHCQGFLNGSRALLDENYENLKTQCYYKLAALVNEGKINLHIPEPVHQQALIEELCVVEEVVTDNKRLKICSKDFMKHQLGRSPDFADAVMMRMWFEYNKRTVKMRISMTDYD